MALFLLLGKMRIETAKRPGSFPVARRPAFRNAAIWFGLRGPDARILSLVGFGHGPHGAGGRFVEALAPALSPEARQRAEDVRVKGDPA
jgi:hypothetical protein